MSGSGIGILFVIVLVGAYFVIRFVLNSAVNKGTDAVTNAWNRSKMENNPPERESLADRYKDKMDLNEENEKKEDI